MFTHIPAPEANVAQLIAQGRYDDALAHMTVGVHHHYKTAEVAHHALYYPTLDQQIAQLAQALGTLQPGKPQAPTRSTLVIATELYQYNGRRCWCFG